MADVVLNFLFLGIFADDTAAQEQDDAAAKEQDAPSEEEEGEGDAPKKPKKAASKARPVKPAKNAKQRKPRSRIPTTTRRSRRKRPRRKRRMKSPPTTSHRRPGTPQNKHSEPTERTCHLLSATQSVGVTTATAMQPPTLS
ncbi:uncharacterized protein LOC125947132 [Dermacentor silvarum]|uniref:uncharacterized protein LOC125947132 n=1 Tax=Dermacentor silvarum TaxID=543639 RepID=UPI00210142FE|nr:uncharacterized protein LOC125947132 [Dermacentor silvarum]